MWSLATARALASRTRVIVLRLVLNSRARAYTVAPCSNPPLDRLALIIREARGPAKRFALSLRAAQASLGALDQQVALRLGHGVDNVHGQLAGRAGRINAAPKPWT